MRDGYGWESTYLRLSVTDKCNLRCRYCSAEPEKLPEAETACHEALSPERTCRTGRDTNQIGG